MRDPTLDSIPFKGEKDGLHRTQVKWIDENVSFNGIVWIVALVGHEVLFISGRYARMFNGATYRRLRSFARLKLDRLEPALTYRNIKKALSGELQ